MQSLQGSYPASFALSIEKSIIVSAFFMCLQLALWYFLPDGVTYTVWKYVSSVGISEDFTEGVFVECVSVLGGSI